MRVQSTLEASTLTGVSSCRKILGALAPAHGLLCFTFIQFGFARYAAVWLGATHMAHLV